MSCRGAVQQPRRSDDRVEEFRDASLTAMPRGAPIADNEFERYPKVIPAIAAKPAPGRLGEPDDIGIGVTA